MEVELINEKQLVEMMIQELEEVKDWVSSKETFYNSDHINWELVEGSLHDLFGLLMLIKGNNGGTYHSLM
jgi:hypothetical protein